MKLNPKLKTFWKTKSKVKVLHGGRASSKTEDTAGVLIYLASKYKLKIACVRKFQANIKQSVYSVIKKKVTSDEEFKPYFDFNDTSIKTKTGSEFLFLGWERNTDQIKGLDDIDIMWIEEGHTLTEEQWKIIKPTILLRKDNAMVIIVFNPNLETDFAYNHFVINGNDGALVQEINYIDNPFLPQSALELIEKEREELEESVFNHIYLGYPKSESEQAFIKKAWIEACIDAHIKLGIEVRGKKVIGYDIADAGNDYCATVETYGILTTNIKEWKAKEDELEQSAEKAFAQADEVGAILVYDCIGVGASAGSAFKRLNIDKKTQVKYVKFDAGDAVINPERDYMPKRKNKDHFENLKAQSWQIVADRMLATYKAVVKGEPYNQDDIISISSSCALLGKLKTELSSPLKDESKRGLVKVESKDDMKKRGIPSPNIADAFIMAYAPITDKVSLWGEII